MSSTSNNKLPPFFHSDRIQFIKTIKSKKRAFDTLTALLIKGQKEVTKNQVFDALIEREKIGNTSVGNGIAIPKAHLPITNPRVAMLSLKNGLELGAADKKAVRLFIAILVPDKQRDQYHMVLSTLNQKLFIDGIPDKILDSNNPSLLVKHFETILFDETST